MKDSSSRKAFFDEKWAQGTERDHDLPFILEGPSFLNLSSDSRPKLHGNLSQKSTSPKTPFDAFPSKNESPLIPSDFGTVNLKLAPRAPRKNPFSDGNEFELVGLKT